MCETNKKDKYVSHECFISRQQRQLIRAIILTSFELFLIGHKYNKLLIYINGTGDVVYILSTIK